MKVLIVAAGIAGDNPDPAGGDIRWLEIAKHWARMGHTVEILTTAGGEKLAGDLGVEGVVFHRMPKLLGDGRLQAVVDTMLMPFRLPAGVWRFSGDVVYSANDQLYDVIPALAVKLRRRSAVRWATVTHWVPPVAPWRRKETRALYALLFMLSEFAAVRLTLWFGDVLLGVSDSTSRRLVRMGVPAGKIATVLCGVPIEGIAELVAQCRTEKPIYDAVFLKRIQRSKGALDLVPIWKRVLEAKPDAKLLVIGDGADSDRLKADIEQNSLQNHIELAGIITDTAQKFRKLAQSRVFVLPTYEENWGLVIGEAMAAGLPVVSYGLSELKEVWQDNFVAVETGDVAAFADAVIHLLKEPDVYEHYSNKGQAFVRRLGWDAIAAAEVEAMRASVGARVPQEEVG